MDVFEIISEIERIETIAIGERIRNIEWLRKKYGSGRWRKQKGLPLSDLLTMEKCLKPNFIGTKLTESERSN
jgi:hypothetical protein